MADQPKSIAYYDPKENIIFADLTGLTLTEAVLTDMTNQVIQVAKTLPEKVFLVSCWKDVKLEQDFAKYFSELAKDLLHHVRGLIRYEVTEPLTRANVRTQTIRGHLQNTQSHIYANREEALIAVRKLEKEQ